MSRVDAELKATGRSRYVADVVLPNLAHVAVARSTMAHARFTVVDTAAAQACEGVIGVFTADDVSTRLYGRSLNDAPLLAQGKVRFVGERVAAVVAETRRQAEAAATLIEIDYDPLPAVTTIAEALAPGAPAVHDAPWEYEGAVAKPDDGPNCIYHGVHGSLEALEEALSRAAYTIDHTYTTQGVHQGYLEPQACIASYESPETVRVWLTNKAPYRVRSIIGHCLGLDPKAIELEPITLGGDFGGKGSPQDAPLCVELSRLVARPVKMVLRYSEDLIAANPRHPSEIRVRMGCDRDGKLVAVSMQARLNAGAYGAFTPNGTGPQGSVKIPSYRVPVSYAESVRVYTNTVPRGNMRAPGAPQGIFALESAMDELAVAAGIDPVELRRRNLLKTGELDADHKQWVEHRGHETLSAALAALERVEPPPGWLYGRGLVIYSRGTTTTVNTSLRLSPIDDDCVRVETPLIETGTGSHTALRRMIADQLALRPDQVEVVGVSTGDLPRDAGAGGSRVTAGFAAAADVAAKAWQNRARDEPIVVEVNDDIGPPVGSYVVQIAHVAVDPETGQLKVLELLSAVDVAEIVNPLAHQMQIDGGAAMGFGFACLEDLCESEGQVWAANLGEYKLPSARDLPRYKTVILPGGVGVGTANVKSIGELTTPPVAAAIANAVFAATGCRIRELPITAERIFQVLQARRPSGSRDRENRGRGLRNQSHLARD